MIGRVVPDAVHLKKAKCILVNEIGSTHHKAAEKLKSFLKLLLIRINSICYKVGQFLPSTRTSFLPLSSPSQ